MSPCPIARSHSSGVGFNIARALSTLGNHVRLVSMVGSDFLGTALRQSMAKFGVSDEFILPVLDETPQSIVIFDGAGRRMVNTDLKDVGERVYSAQLFTRALQGCRAAVMTNVGFRGRCCPWRRLRRGQLRPTCKQPPKAVKSMTPISFRPLT